MNSALHPSRRALRPFVFLLLLAAWLPGAAAAQAIYHVMAKGETLYSVARSFQVTVADIAKANSIDDPSKVRVGMRLLIPRDYVARDAVANDARAQDAGSHGSSPSAAAAPPTAGMQTYKVVKGDTLFSIAKGFGIGLDALRSANRMKASSMIKPGDALRIPSGGKQAPAAGGKPDSVPAAAATGPDPVQRPPAAPPTAEPMDPPASSAATPMPEPVKTSAKAVDRSLSWPCPGQIVYLDGKAYGVVIRSAKGEAIKAVASGTVSSAGPYRGYGNVVFVLSRGYIYVYGGNESLSVKAGDKVTAGQELGKVGMDAKQGGPAAYFLVFKNGSAVDPAAAPRDRFDSM